MNQNPTDIVLSVEHISKEYYLKKNANYSLNFRDLFFSLPELLKTDQKVTALQDVNFTVQRGEVVGIIGKNGAGKSTLLKIISGITSPTKGQVKIYGKSLSVLDIGTGFHPDLSGRENVNMISQLLGLNKQEIGQRFDKIVEFSEIGAYINKPVKFYSSGMFLRLAFSVVAFLGADIIFLDEVLAVGDVSFQEKCINRIYQLKAEGASLIFVSHNIQEIINLCDRIIYLEGGRIVADGDPSIIIRQYLDRSHNANEDTIDTNIQHKSEPEDISNNEEPIIETETEVPIVDDALRRETEEASKLEKLVKTGLGSNEYIELIKLETTDKSGALCNTFTRDDKIYVTFSYKIIKENENVMSAIVITDMANTRLFCIDTIQAEDQYRNQKGIYEACFTIPSNVLGINNFSMEIIIAAGGSIIGRFTRCCNFDITGERIKLADFRIIFPIQVDTGLILKRIE